MTKSAASNYHAALASLQAAELEFEAALDALAAARKGGSPARVTDRRCAAEAAEQHVRVALEHAMLAHRAYWDQRRAAMVPAVREAACLLWQFNRVARAAGLPGDPAMAIIHDVQSRPVPGDVVDDVPIEQPDCPSLEYGLGAWR